MDRSAEVQAMLEIASPLRKSVLVSQYVDCLLKRKNIFDEVGERQLHPDLAYTATVLGIDLVPRSTETLLTPNETKWLKTVYTRSAKDIISQSSDTGASSVLGDSDLQPSSPCVKALKRRKTKRKRSPVAAQTGEKVVHIFDSGLLLNASVPALLFRYYDENSMGVNGITGIWPECPLPYQHIEKSLFSYFKQHLNREHTGSPFISTTDSFIWALQMGLRQHPSRHRKIAIVDGHRLLHNSRAWHALPLCSKLKRDKLVKWRYNGTHEWLVSQISQDDIIATLDVDDIECDELLEIVLNFEVLQSHTWLAAARTELQKQKASYSSMAHAVVRLAKLSWPSAPNLGASPYFSDLINIVLRDWGLTKGKQEWKTNQPFVSAINKVVSKVENAAHSAQHIIPESILQERKKLSVPPHNRPRDLLRCIEIPPHSPVVVSSSVSQLSVSIQTDFTFADLPASRSPTLAAAQLPTPVSTSSGLLVKEWLDGVWIDRYLIE